MAHPGGMGPGYPKLTGTDRMGNPQKVSVVVPIFRDDARALQLVDTLAHQRLPVDTSMEIILVDDGSDDGSLARLKDAMAASPDVTVLALRTNVGRSAARNAGAARANGALLLFIDCDCLPASDHWIAAHLAELTSNMVATTGPVTGNGSGFWHRYQTDASTRRSKSHASGEQYAGSSQNFMVRRSAFVASGGFDIAFRTYGFEDRDMFLRLGLQGPIGWAESASVRHMDLLSMRNIAKKMAEAGGDAAVHFSARHPRAYQVLGYSNIDARKHRWLRPVARLATPLMPQIADSADRLLAAQWWPYVMKRVMVRWLTALSYLCGTAGARW